MRRGNAKDKETPTRVLVSRTAFVVDCNVVCGNWSVFPTRFLNFFISSSTCSQ